MSDNGYALQSRRLTVAVVGFTLAVCMAASSYGGGELGPLDGARKSHPAIFVEGNVLKYTVGGKNGYVCNGSAEQCFVGGQAESDAELYREASLDARRNLIRFLKKGLDGTVEIRLSGMRKLYEYPEGKIRRVICFVEDGNVSVVELPEVGKGVPAVKQQIIAEHAPLANPVSSAAPNSTNACADAVIVPAVSAHAPLSASTASKDEPPVDLLDAYMKGIAKDPSDCILLSKAVKINVRRGHFSEASRLHSEIVKNVIANEKMDAEFAADLLLEAARFEAAQGNVACALKYYRLLVRCDGLRRWKLQNQVDEANKNISRLSLNAE